MAKASEVLAMFIAEGQGKVTSAVQSAAVYSYRRAHLDGIASGKNRYLVCAIGPGLDDIKHLMSSDTFVVDYEGDRGDAALACPQSARIDANFMFRALISEGRLSCWVFTSSFAK